MSKHLYSLLFKNSFIIISKKLYVLINFKFSLINNIRIKYKLPSINMLIKIKQCTISLILNNTLLIKSDCQNQQIQRMGNIEIKQENNQQNEYINSARSKRATIFDNNNKSLTPNKKQTNQCENRLISSQLYQQQNCYSPIRFSKNKSRALNESQVVLTQKKYNHSRSKTDKNQYAKYSPVKTNKYKVNNDFQESRYCNSNLKHSNYIESRITHNRNLHSNPLNNTMTDRTSDKQYEIQELKRSHQHGKIVPNSARKSSISYRQQAQHDLYYPEHNQSYLNQKQNYQSGIGQNKEMIKKVRNFNDFLNQIKRKLKQESFATLQRKKSIKQHLRKSSPKHSSNFNKKYDGLSKSSIQYLPNGVFQEQTFAMDYQQHNEEQYQRANKSKYSSGHHKLQIALKLENQKLELEKYRKLVQRQLSKNHSIQNISLSTKKSGEKILTIQYENLQNPNDFKKKKVKLQKKEEILISDLNQDEQVQLNQQFKASKQQVNQDDRLQELKIEYQTIMKKMIKIGQIIQTISKPKKKHSFKDTPIKQIIKNQQLDQKKQKIDNLFDKLAIIQTDCIQSEKKVKQLIYSSEISDSSQSLS